MYIKSMEKRHLMPLRKITVLKTFIWRASITYSQYYLLQVIIYSNNLQVSSTLFFGIISQIKLIGSKLVVATMMVASKW